MRVVMAIFVASLFFSGCALKKEGAWEESTRSQSLASAIVYRDGEATQSSPDHIQLSEHPSSQTPNNPAKPKNWIYYKGANWPKRVALTFDDGPDYYYTTKILDILKREKVLATFFIMGKNANKYPDVLKRIAREGHLIGNHSWNHADFSKLSAERMKWEIRSTEDLIYRTIGVRPNFFRPPFGAMSNQLKNYIKDSRYSIIYWNVDTRDWTERPAYKIMDVIRKKVNSGDIVLLHSAGGGQSLQGTLDALPQVIHFLRQQGFQLVTVDELLQLPAYADPILPSK
ncbi:polysaccharide deacetylase family protein [Thermoflavimicrobium dichotomicum]|uniref:Peptidoglycan/xylan/chitin deacetylase, PgdA/CDA1 family n=1 Tax=Thermoflavimicrobium dichotomicum TaxID=46223 RepID=A0A1I3R3Z4_9BACL|nr:polysaccharide deacetylase family protein [Thermoflavimicrobium dichotomicum]SFJ41294.1 Peptidoglycan/xylan/chitin deacetylase, PgdA/CDA1 family [Thermoflavimicrobium dichotomicum]